MTFRNQIVGVIRFSMPALGGFQYTPREVDACEAMLFEEERLNIRFDLFQRFCLPTLLNQTDPRFKALILIGRNLPEKFYTKLDMLTAELEGVHLVQVEPDRQTQMVSDGLAQLPAKGFTHRTTFRLDDDDMMDIDYIARLRRQCRMLQKMTPFKPFAIANSLGYYVDVTGKQPVFFEQIENTPLGLGLSLTVPTTWEQHCFMVNHRKFASFYNLYSWKDEASFIRTIHEKNDGERHAGAKSKEISKADMQDILPARFGITWDSLIHE